MCEKKFDEVLESLDDLLFKLSICSVVYGLLGLGLWWFVTRHWF